MACSAQWHDSGPSQTTGPFPRRSYEMAAILAGLVVAWPAALTYLAWKLAGYPGLDALRGAVERVRGEGFAFAGGFAPRSDNLAFEEYRRAELDRLEAERRRLDEEGRAFAEFVRELKRAKDREEFDAFMARRRASQAGA